MHLFYDPAFYVALPLLLGICVLGYFFGFRAGRAYEAEEINQALMEAQMKYREQMASTFSFQQHPEEKSK